MRATCVAAVDVGTSAVRAAIVGSDGLVAASTRVARSSDLGGELYDPAALLTDVTTALRGIAGAGVPEAVVLSAHIGTVLVDSALEPVGLGGGWADRRGLDVLTALPDQLTHSIRSAAHRPALTGGGLAVLLGLDPAHRVRVAAVLSPKDHLVAALTGELATDTIDAAYTLASVVRTREWNTEALVALGLQAGLFPRQVEPTAVVGRLTPAAAVRTGLPPGTPVLGGGPDGSVGIGLLLGTSTHAIADVAGTTDVLGRLLAPGENTPDCAVLNPALLPGRFVAGGATGLTGGAVARWRSLVGAPAEAELAAVPPGSGGLQMLPSMSGARFPRWRAAACGALIGQRPEHGPTHLLRAAQEGATFSVREGIDLLDPTGLMPVVFAGGSARSEQVAQLRADVLGRTMLVSPEPDVTLLGAAAIGLVGTGAVRGFDEVQHLLLGEVREVQPDPTRVERYELVYEEWRMLSDTLDQPHERVLPAIAG